jgi:glycosyltransferase involved in cell wall biosynthesis
MQKIKIGVLAYRMDYYTNLRNIVNKLPEADYVPVKDFFSYRRALALKLNRFIGKPLFPTFDLNNQFEDFDLNKVDVLHFSNGVSLGRTPWVSHFETLLPRFSDLMQRYHGTIKNPLKMTPLIQRGFNALQSPSCKRIIAMSQAAANMQQDLLSELPFEEREVIRKKMIVLHPPQEILAEQPAKRAYNRANPIRFILVGAGFFRKGGREILNAFDNLIKSENAPIKLVLVSSLRLDPYASKETQTDIIWADRFLKDHSDWIEHYETLPHTSVMELMKTCDVGLLPTYADSYGFSVLEAQACGLPVISTNVRALPEINNANVGWLIHVPKNEMSEALYSSAEERSILSEHIQAGLEAIILRIIADPSIIAQKGQAALDRIRVEHDPQTYAEKLRQIYQAALT